jgi:hypothetical protein
MDTVGQGATEVRRALQTARIASVKVLRSEGVWDIPGRVPSQRSQENKRKWVEGRKGEENMGPGQH